MEILSFERRIVLDDAGGRIGGHVLIGAVKVASPRRWSPDWRKVAVGAKMMTLWVLRRPDGRTM